MINMDAAAAAVDHLESALASHRGAAANWDAAVDFIHAPPTDTGLALRHVVPLPPAFVSQYSSFQYKSFMGLFPEVGRAWLTADTRLFLWSYAEDRVLRGAPAADDFYAYDAFDQIIVAVALVKPRPNVFIDDVRYLIAVATSVEVTLLGVTFSGNGPAGEVSLIPTNISVATDGVLVLSISSTPDGRIFMAGDDGNLHEFAYYGEPTGWASALLGSRAAKRPRKLLHKSTSIVNYILPTALSSYFSKTDSLVDMTVDSPRNALYTLSSAGKLSVYDIADTSVARLVRTVDVSHEARSLLSYSFPASEREYIAIFAVPSHMSEVVHLVVVTSLGERIYFSASATSFNRRSSSSFVASASFTGASSSYGTSGAGTGSSPGSRGPTGELLASGISSLVGSKRLAPGANASATPTAVTIAPGQRPSTLKCMGYRPSPVRDVGVNAQRPCVHMALWASGSVVLCDLRQNDNDQIISIFPDPAGGRDMLSPSSTPGSSPGCGSGNGAPSHSQSGSPTAPRALLPPAGQIRPAEAVYSVMLRDAGSAIGTSGGGHGSGMATPGSRAADRGAGSSAAPYSRTYALAAVQSPNSVEAAASEGRTVAPLLEPGTMFWVLTSSAMQLYARVEPKQKLAHILTSSGGGAGGADREDDYELSFFFKYHGVAEASAICLQLATSDPTMAERASRALYKHGGRALLSASPRPGGTGGWLDGQPDAAMDASGVGASTAGRAPLSGSRRGSLALGGRASSGFDLGRPSLRAPPVATFSGVHDGICIYLAQILRPVWNEFMCSSRDPNTYQRLVLSPTVLVECRDSICALVSFLTQHEPEEYLPWEEEDAAPGSAMRDSGLRGGSTQRSPHYLRTLSAPQYDRHHQLSPHQQHHQQSGRFDTGDRTIRSTQEKIYGKTGVHRIKKSSEARRIEVVAIRNVVQLASRCSEALAFLSILSDHQLHRIVPALQPDVRNELVDMQFCDLVARNPGAIVSTALIEVLFSSFAAAGNDLAPLCKLLQSRCRSYFDDDDMTLQSGLQRIRTASERLGLCGGDDALDITIGSGFSPWNSESITDEDRDHSIQLAEEAVHILKPLSDRIFNVQAVCSQVARVGAVPAAVELALTVGDASERICDEIRASQAFECVLQMIEPLIDESVHGRTDAVPSVSGETLSPDNELSVPGTQRKVDRRKDATIRVALSSTSDRFHDMLYEFFMKSKAGERELLCRPSIRVGHFLQTKGRRDLLWKFFAQHGRHADAAGVLVSLADEDGNATLLDRLGFYSRALHNAKTAVSLGDAKASALETDIKDYMDVARVQLRLRDELNRRHENDVRAKQALKDLDMKVMDLTILYNEFALPFGLLESTLDILRCGSYRDDQQVRALWMQIVDEEIASSQVPSLVEQRIVALGRDFYPSDVSFPTQFIVDLLERQTFERREDPAWSSVAAGWVGDTLCTVGVPLGEIVDAYRGMIESTGQGNTGWSWSDEHGQLHAIRGAERSLGLWAEKAESRSGRFDIERRMLVAESEKALRTIALCKSRLRGMSNATAHALVQRFDAIENGISVV
jgi:Nup133 N terminal like/Non-repetitive/WGA-negative nucleoporin C-terminal